MAFEQWYLPLKYRISCHCAKRTEWRVARVALEHDWNTNGPAINASTEPSDLRLFFFSPPSFCSFYYFAILYTRTLTPLFLVSVEVGGRENFHWISKVFISRALCHGACIKHEPRPCVSYKFFNSRGLIKPYFHIASKAAPYIKVCVKISGWIRVIY